MKNKGEKIADEVWRMLPDECKNNYAFLNEKQPASKTRLNKCKKGFHEFSESGFSENNIKKWSCIHCGVLMHNR